MEEPITRERVLQALAIEVRAMQDERDAGREISADRRRRARSYLDALGVEREP